MAAERETDHDDDPELGNGDRLRERLENIDIESADTCSTDEMRELLGL